MPAMAINGMERVLRSIEKAKQRRQRALALRKAGKTVEQVGDALGVSKQRASQILAQARKEATAA